MPNQDSNSANKPLFVLQKTILVNMQYKFLFPINYIYLSFFAKRKDSSNWLNIIPDNFCCIASGFTDNFIGIIVGILLFSFNAEVILNLL